MGFLLPKRPKDEAFSITSLTSFTPELIADKV